MLDKKYKIVVAEDDPNLGQLLTEYLEVQGFNVTYCKDGREAWLAILGSKFDLGILDVMMPKEDGFTLARRVKNSQPDLPLLFLSARGQVEDRIEGLSIGADDYMTKPFSMRELLLRIHAILKRSEGRVEESPEQSIYHFGQSCLKVDSRHLELAGKVVKLTNKELELLKVLAANFNTTVRRSEVLRKVWGHDTFHNARSMDVYVGKLRKHLKDDSTLEIVTVHGEGLRLVEIG